MNNKQVAIYLISLKDSKVRREFMQSQLTKMGLDFEFIDAVDGKSLDSNIALQIEQQRDRQLYSKPFTRGEIGCMSSHMNIYDRISTSTRENHLILEDDVFLSSELTQLLEPSAIDALPANWDIILLAYVQRGNIESMPRRKAVMSFWHRTTLPNNMVVGRPVQFCYHTAAYMVSKQGAKKLKAVGLPLRMPADILTGNSQVWGLNLYTISKPIVWQDEEVALQSTIKEDRQDSQLAFDLAQDESKSFASTKKQVKHLFIRMLSYLWNKAIMCTKGHTFPVVFLRQLEILPPDEI